MHIKKQALPRTLLTLALSSLALLAGTALAASTTVTYVKPDNFTDMPRYQPEQERVMRAFTAHFQSLADKLPASQALAISVTNIDLAGRIDMMRRMGNDDIRILNGGADWPRIELHYALTENGQVLSSGDEQIADMMYLQRINRYASGEPLRYEKAMLDDWFYKTFPAAKPK